eukprot:EG_transcript_22864
MVGVPSVALSRSRRKLVAVPKEISVLFMSFLPAAEVLKLCQVCRAFARLCDEWPYASVLWQNLIIHTTWRTPRPRPLPGPRCDKATYRLVHDLPIPRHGWFFGPNFTADLYGDTRLFRDSESDMQWCGEYVAVRRGCCFTTLDLKPSEEAVTLTAWLKATKECNLACKCGAQSCVNYYIDYEADGEWHWLAMVERKTCSDWFMDGEFVYTFSNEGFLDKWREKGQFAIGRGSPVPSFRAHQFEGFICQVCLWD